MFIAQSSLSKHIQAMERLLTPMRGGTLANLIHAAFRRENISPNVVYEGSSIGCIDLVKAGMGVSLHAREFAAVLARDTDISCVEIEPPILFAYGLGHRNPSELSHAEQLYLSHMKKYEISAGMGTRTSARHRATARGPEGDVPSVKDHFPDRTERMTV